MGLFEASKKKQKPEGLKIIIAGASNLGEALVSTLVDDGHDIVIIDQNAGRIQEVTDRYDVMGVIGNAASMSVLTDAGIQGADLLLGVTQSDEFNLLCCVIGKRISNCDVIARVRNPVYSEEAEYLKEKMGLARIINADQETAMTISRMLFMPNTLSVNSFANGMAEMVRIRLPKDNMLVGKMIAQLGQELSGALLICGVERDHEVHIPNGLFTLEAGDIVTFITPVTNGLKTMKRIGFDTKPVKSVMLIGGGILAYYLLDILTKQKIKITVIEQNKERCEQLSMQFPEVVVINGDGTDGDLLNESGIRDVEAVVTLTGIDQENIMLAPLVKEVSDAKVIAKVTRNHYNRALEMLEVDTVVYPKAIASEGVVGYVRSKSAAVGSNIKTLVQLFDGRAEAIEFDIEKESAVTGKPLRDLKVKSNLLITCINRDGRIIIPGGNDEIRVGDSVIIFTTQHGCDDIEDILR